MSESTARSPRFMRRVNSAALVRFALQTGEFTAAEAMAETGLTRATVLALCDGLIHSGWLEEVANSRAAGIARTGRPARRYRLRERVGLLVAIDAGEHRFTVSVADLRGTPLGTAERAVDAHAVGPEGRVAAAREMVAQALMEAGAEIDDVLLTVIGLPAPVDADGLSPQGDGLFWPLMNPGFSEISSGTVVVENDANLAALAEQAQNPGTARQAVATLLTGERLGAGIIVDGRLLRGPRGGVGEMRFLDLIFPVRNAAAGLGALARVWAQEEMLSSRRSSTLRRLPLDDITAEDVFQAARDGDEVAKEIIERLGARLARVALVLASLLDVEHVVIAGAIASAVEPVLAKAREVLRAEFYPPFPELTASVLGGDVVVRGAIQLALSLIRARPFDFVLRSPGRVSGQDE